MNNAKSNSRCRRRQAGAILGVVVLVVLAVSLVGVGLVSLGTRDAVEVVREAVAVAVGVGVACP